jgi:hypothetical protein
MKRVILVTALALAATVTVSAHEKPRGPHSKKAAKKESVAREVPPEATYVHFSMGEQQVIREYYAPRYRSLPPGLRKKVARGGQLPPGWQKKIEPFPYEIERRLAPMPSDCGRGVIDGHAVIYRTGSQRVIDVTVLF